MSESPDDMLTRPLGLAAPEAPPAGGLRAFRLTGPRVSLALGGGAALVLGLLLLAGDPQGGEPRVRTTIAFREADPAPRRPAAPEAAQVQAAAASSLHSTAAEIEKASGVTVTRPAGAAAPEEAVIIRVPTPDGVRLAPAPDPRLTERGRHGAMPRLGEGRIRPLDVYARPDDGAGAARIAILISGLGTGQAVTAAAIARLPAPVSLAFSPYAPDIDKVTARAREAGHETLVQVPMEPFDYPDSDPGPQALLAASRPAENLDRLAWAMSRFSGFVGIANLMGGKLMSDPAALEPVLKELAGRGIGFVDDGAAQGSQVAAAAARVKAPAARAEIVIDAAVLPEAIDRELARLEAQARRTGFVLASAGARQLTIDRIARWARDLDARGIRLVPVSAALRGAPRGRLSSAEH